MLLALNIGTVALLLPVLQLVMMLLAVPMLATSSLMLPTPLRIAGAVLTTVIFVQTLLGTIQVQ